jgi:hypothetical protein
VRAEEKIDPELERVAEEEIVEQLEEKEAPEQEQAEEVDASALRFHQLVAYIEALIAGNRDADVDFGWLSDVEQRGLQLLAEAIGGRATGSSRQIFAEDRMEMLEQALAALQPVLAAGFESADVDVGVYDTLVGELTELRAELSSLADAQEEIVAQDTMRMLGRDGKPKPPSKPPDAGEVGDDRPSTLAGPGPAVEKPAAPSTLAGPGPAVETPAPPSTLATGGPPAPEKKPQPSSAWDDDERRR